MKNNKLEVTKSLEELDKIEDYIEQVLFYARSNEVEKDYCIKKCNKDIVNTVIKRNKNVLIQNRIKIILENIEQQIYTDSKWCIFILNQIIQNCIKYKKENEGLEENSYIAIKRKINKDNIIIKMISPNNSFFEMN